MHNYFNIKYDSRNRRIFLKFPRARTDIEAFEIVNSFNPSPSSSIKKISKRSAHRICIEDKLA